VTAERLVLLQAAIQGAGFELWILEWLESSSKQPVGGGTLTGSS